MKKKRYIIIILCFAILTLIESGIFIEIMWHGWGGFGGVTLVYNEAGQNGVSVLLFFIPLSVLIALFLRIALCLKERSGAKKLLTDCIYAFLGVGIGLLWNLLLGYYDILNPCFLLGRRITAFLIDHFDWMDLPLP